ncbi:uncharacterized protein HKW66_Vig0097360 [Vigna angularis]|uniref:RWP-RK domain-containing protein n=1 Tax=Phaseolus angularis TaxID=3914 RepID=A0A8T0KK37_PHAAN|nr:uncharacterized protein HKW66_Vig0097360 [Vigna angularis]
MDNNCNNYSDSFHSPLIGNYIEPDPALIYILNDQPNVQQRNAQQNDPFVVEQDHVSFTGLTIQDVSTHSDNDFTIGGVPNLENGGWSTRKRKFPYMDSMIEGHPVHGDNTFPNELQFWPPGPFDIDIDASFDPFLHNLIDRDISIFDLSNDELIAPSSQQNALPQHQHAVPGQQNALCKQPNAPPQNQNLYPFGLEQIHVPILNPTFQDQSLHVNYNFATGEVPNIDMEGPSRRKVKQPMAEHPLLKHGILNEEDVVALDHWPPSPKSMSCSCCQILRQIIHTDGFKFEKLEIHGSLGVIGHAIFHVQDMTPGGEPPREVYQMIKQVLTSICVALFRPQKHRTNKEFPGSILQGPDKIRASTARPKPKRNMAVQRKRVPKMTMNDLSPFFHLTIRDAADKLEVSDSVVKKISRLGNLKRWPQRKLQSLAKDVRVLRKALDSPYEGTRQRVRQEIQRLQLEMVAICGGVTPTGIEIIQFEEE